MQTREWLLQRKPNQQLEEDNMKATEILNDITKMLNLSTEVKLEEQKLENGTIIEAEKFESEQEVFIKTDDEQVPLPVGMYELEDGKQLIVVDEGIINEIKSQIDESMKDDQVLAEEPKEEKEEMGYATKEELAEVQSVVEEIKAMIEEMQPKEEEAPAEAEVEAAKEEIQELKEELSKPATTPKRHSPEAQTRKSTSLYSQNRSMNTLDRVMGKISNIKSK